MLTISKTQMDAFAAAMDERYWRVAMAQARADGSAEALLAQAPKTP